MSFSCITYENLLSSKHANVVNEFISPGNDLMPFCVCAYLFFFFVIMKSCENRTKSWGHGGEKERREQQNAHKNGKKREKKMNLKLLHLLPYKWCSLDLYLVEGEEEEEDLFVVGALSGLSILGFESVGDAVTPSSEPALLLRLADPLFASLLLAGIVLHTLSSLRDRPMKRDTLPVPWRAASINVPAGCVARVCVFVPICADRDDDDDATNQTCNLFDDFKIYQWESQMWVHSPKRKQAAWKRNKYGSNKLNWIRTH